MENPKTPEELLAQAASAALPMLEAKMEERASLLAKLQAVTYQIGSLTAVCKAAGMAVTGHTPSLFIEPPPLPLRIEHNTSGALTGSASVLFGATGTLTAVEGDKPPSAYVRLSAILHSRIESFTANELSDLYKQEFNVRLPTSTLYAALAKGKRKGTFLVDADGKWRSAKGEGSSA